MEFNRYSRDELGDRAEVENPQRNDKVFADVIWSSNRFLVGRVYGCGMDSQSYPTKQSEDG